VVLVHGLDEPGDIWDDLVAVLGASGIAVWELRYPNDQGVDRSADLLAELWPTLPSDLPIVLIGHSMGGLVIRDFVTRWRHPVGAAAPIGGAAAAGVILVGTPNQGSEWARFRVWLEVRDHLAAGPERRFSLFAALRDGTGAAKIDLRPGSAFLEDLNARPWPASIRLALIGGVLTEPPASVIESVGALQAELGSPDLAAAVESWWSGLGADLGDGAVSVDSLPIPHGPEPILLTASHRGLLARAFPGDAQPPAIEVIMRILTDWTADRTGQSWPDASP
jgi:pimeloyl-ACP methyl ester carboxylesterase